MPVYFRSFTLQDAVTIIFWELVCFSENFVWEIVIRSLEFKAELKPINIFRLLNIKVFRFLVFDILLFLFLGDGLIIFDLFPFIWLLFSLIDNFLRRVIIHLLLTNWILIRILIILKILLRNHLSPELLQELHNRLILLLDRVLNNIIILHRIIPEMRNFWIALG